ncbi:hypothetical protein [Armillaria borealis ambi-like virus 1]|nr:hypothetical protein [Armillaria borealis ambi-like virus 1]
MVFTYRSMTLPWRSCSKPVSCRSLYDVAPDFETGGIGVILASNKNASLVSHSSTTMSVIFESAVADRKSVFLVAPRGPALDSTTEFKEKGLSAFAPEKPSLLEYFGAKRRTSLASDLYVTNLAAILYASVYKCPVPAVYTVSVQS